MNFALFSCLLVSFFVNACLSFTFSHRSSLLNTNSLSTPHSLALSNTNTVRKLYSSDESSRPNTPGGTGLYEELAQKTSMYIKSAYKRMRNGEMFAELQKDCIITCFSFARNVQVGVWGERGEQWFAVQLALLVFIFSGKMPLGWLFNFFGFILLLSGFGMVSIATLTLRECVSPFVIPATTVEFKSEGLYRWVRHPIYGGVILFCTGWSIVSNSLDRAMLTFLLSVVLNQKAALEESYLRKLYSRYADYSLSRCKLVPFVY